ncbi:MAG: tRNA (N(6)-L-threonylcarbamoyladenosine(37)-C(2))-methylthiotransferase MtaB [Rhodothalassiaceae bacterium]
MSRRKGPEVITFGCRLNAFESEVIRRHAAAAGLDDAIIVNSCAVTAEAMRQTRQAIRKARRAHPGARLVVTGCGAQVAAGMFAAMPEVDHVIGNAEKLRAESYRTLAGDAAPRVAVNDIFSVRETAGHLIDGFEGRARAFIEVQTGCDHRCTFCIIPYGRGHSRSVPVAAVIAQVRRLVANGYREIVLSGVDITAYGADLEAEPTLGDLVAQILDAVPGLPRLRLSSLDPVEVDDRLFDLVTREARLMPHLHLSVQAGDDLILKRMKRRHCRDDVIRFCEAVRAQRPEVVFGADIIAGFPTESEAMFAQSLDLVRRCEITWLHVFPYSARDGTPAARMPQVPMAVRKARARRLRALGAEQVSRLYRRLSGKMVAVLVERSEGDAAFGHSEHFAPVRIAGALRPGDLVTACVTGEQEGMLVAEPAASALREAV